MTILITGANGTVSSALLRVLDSGDDSNEVRALVRDPAKAPDGVPAAIGDLDVPASLPAAFAAVDVLWLLTTMGRKHPTRARTPSGQPSRPEPNTSSACPPSAQPTKRPRVNGRLHALSDAELVSSGLDWTIIKPATFMQNLTGALVDGTLYGSTGEGRVGMIDVRDIADFAATSSPIPHPTPGEPTT